jgi:cytidylate kinase
MAITRQPIVAIDGPAGSGKSTVAMRAAEHTGLQFISSGAMYRAVALRALRAGIPATDHDRLTALAAQLRFRFSTDTNGTVRTFVDGADVTDALRAPAVGELASTVATISALRATLVEKLREYGQHGGVVMEGRDIQTVVFPAADIKVYLTASAEERAQRRWRELAARGEQLDYADVLAEVRDRDTRDAGRDASPLRAAEDAIPVDTDGQTIEQVVHCLVQLIETWRGGHC